MSKPRTLQQYVDWFVEWAGGEGAWPCEMCLDTVMKIARKKGYGIAVDGDLRGWWAVAATNGIEKEATARYEPIYAALRALYQAVEEKK